MTELTKHRLPRMRRPLDYEPRLGLSPGQRRAGFRDWQAAYTASSLAIDVGAAAAAAALAVALRFGDAAPQLYIALSFLLAPLWVLLVTMSRAYEQRFIGVGTEELRRVLQAGVVLLALVAFCSYAAKAEISRGFVVMAIPGTVALSLLGRGLQRSWLHRQRAGGRCVQRTLLVGSPSAVRWTMERLRTESSHGMEVVGACLSKDLSAELLDTEVTTFGDLADVVDAVRKTDADVVTVLSSALLGGDDLRRLNWLLEPLRADLVVCSGLTDISGARVTIRPAAHAPMLQVAHARLSGPSRVIKGAFDRLGALAGVVLISPLLLAVALAIWAHDRKSPFFRQTRVGLNGREFRMWKFRTMVIDAEARKTELLALNEFDGGVLFKIADDPRITPVGKWLRKYSVDELPQLFNVVRGEMSLVGPRPPLATEVQAYGQEMRRRLLVKPGMTGLWQVSGRSRLSWAESEQLDIRYVENWSLAYDLTILWRTARAVVFGAGAH